MQTETTIEFYSRDIQILRQSQSKMALEYVNHVGAKVTFAELQRITDIFVECCLRPQDDELKERVKKLDNWLKSKSEGNE
jgi:hypothetical protein